MTVYTLFANNASSRLYAVVDATTTSIRVEAGDGILFPQPAGGTYFMVTVEDRRTSQIEIMKCTGRSGDILNVTRHQEGTTAQMFMAGATVSNRLTAGTLTTLADAAGVTEAPADGKQYGRQDETWTQVTWTSVANKPATFPPTLPIPSSGITGLDAKQAAQDTAITDNQTAITSINATLPLKEDKANKGAASGYAPLDATTKVPAAYLPAYVDDVIEFASLAAFPPIGSTGLIYVALDTGKIYRWSGSAYIEISPSPGSTDAVPEGATNKYYTDERVDDRTAALLQSGTGISWSYNDSAGTLTPTVTLAPFSTTNLAEGTNLYYTNARASAAAPVQSVNTRTGAVLLTKSDVGLGNVDNTSDLAKPISTATQTALNLKADINSPTFTGDPKAPTPATADNDTSIATTAYVKANLAALPAPGIGDAPSDGLTYGRKNATWSTIVGGAVISDTAPIGTLQPGQLWWEADTGDTYIYFNDGDSSQWVQQNVIPSASSASSGAVPAGSIGWFASSSAPTGYLKANGAAISRTNYLTLFTAIGTAFGVGDGSTTFNLPDLRGEFVRSWDDSRGVDVGRAFGSAQADDTESHTHTFTGSSATSSGWSADHTHTFSGTASSGGVSANHTHTSYGNAGGSTFQAGSGYTLAFSAQTGTISVDHSHSTTISGTSAGASVGHTHTLTATGTNTAFGGAETRPRNVALLACIRY